MSNPRIKLEDQVIKKAMKDDSFRKKLLEDPKIVFELETGVKLPESLNIMVLQEDQNNVYLVIPPFRSIAAEEELTGTVRQEPC